MRLPPPARDFYFIPNGRWCDGVVQVNSPVVVAFVRRDRPDHNARDHP